MVRVGVISVVFGLTLGVGACGGGHGLADDAVNAGGDVACRCAKALAQFRKLLLGAGQIELHVAAEEVVGAEIAEHEVSVGDRGVLAAPAIGQ
jgi:hypothetical protein